jgi:hypothetical protein
MTFDPPHDDAEYVEVPAPPGSFRDLADVHLVSTATLSGVAAARPDLDWDVRRFRPSVVVELGGGAAAFTEDSWCGDEVGVGGTRLRIDQDLKYREIGVLMGLSTETVKSHLFQARRHLKGELTDYFEPDLSALAEETR